MFASDESDSEKENPDAWTSGLFVTCQVISQIEERHWVICGSESMSMK